MSQKLTRCSKIGFSSLVIAVLGLSGPTAFASRPDERVVVPAQVFIERIGGADGELQVRTIELKAKLVQRSYSTAQEQVKAPISAKNFHWFKMFENVTVAEKSRRFWNSVDGLTPTAAYAIVSRGFMSHAPHSWADFEEEMRLAQEEIKNENFYHIICIEKKATNEPLLFGHEEAFTHSVEVYADKELAQFSVNAKVSFNGMDLEFPEYEKIELSFDGREVKVVTAETETHKIQNVKVTKTGPKEYEVEITGERKKSE